MKGIPLFLLTLTVFAAQAQTQTAKEDRVRRLITAFAEARNGNDGNAVAAFYSEDGEWIQNHATATVHGRVALAQFWSQAQRAQAHVDRAILSIEFPGTNIAIVRVSTQYGPPVGLHSEVFVLVDESALIWKIRIHQTLD
jgi:uncharacterized protein (TIGR02246 family)